ncbi:MAG TPA: hypothetical protein VNG31_05180 [Candidatus Baltobacteraceae bacterium]|nr:hypothetical protein [Candidatus Baltobacteraceae bacterium]
MVDVMPDRTMKEPTELLIWTASLLVALLIGVGCAFVLWVPLHRASLPGMAVAAVWVLSVGLVLIAFSVERSLTRASLVVLAVMLVVGYTLGGPQFAHLVP